MENGSLVGLSRQIALSRELDVVANNIANLNTTGYKSGNTVFHEFLMPGVRANQFRGADQLVSFVQDRATWTDFSQGSVQPTGNPLDVAVSGNAFLTVQTPRGERYTRNGALQIDATGQLVTAEGHAVQGDGGPIRFQITDNGVTISDDGTIRVREGANSKSDSIRGKLRLVSFAQAQKLVKEGANLYSGGEGNAAQPDTTSKVRQGFIEKSNVNSVAEMSRMIEVTRAYTQISAMLQQQGDLRKSALEKLADVPA